MGLPGPKPLSWPIPYAQSCCGVFWPINASFRLCSSFGTCNRTSSSPTPRRHPFAVPHSKEANQNAIIPEDQAVPRFASLRVPPDQHETYSERQCRLPRRFRQRPNTLRRSLHHPRLSTRPTAVLLRPTAANCHARISLATVQRDTTSISRVAITLSAITV